MEASAKKNRQCGEEMRRRQAKKNFLILEKKAGIFTLEFPAGGLAQVEA
jgi:hypothetical protein